MSVQFTIEGGATTRFADNAIIVQLNDGQKIQADALQDGDVFLIRRGDWATINSVPVVT